MSAWISYLYFPAAGLGVRVVFALIGRWLAPDASAQVIEEPMPSQPVRALPPRPQLGDYHENWQS